MTVSTWPPADEEVVETRRMEAAHGADAARAARAARVAAANIVNIPPPLKTPPQTPPSSTLSLPQRARCLLSLEPDATGGVCSVSVGVEAKRVLEVRSARALRGRGDVATNSRVPRKKVPVTTVKTRSVVTR